MIKRELIDLISSRTKISHRELIEKDLILHKLLVELSSSDEFNKNYAFKGGTCLLKCYLSYYRFSEDLDFTYINQKEFENKSGKEKRKIFSNKINDTMKLIVDISVKIGMEFEADKKNNRYVELGSSSNQVTFKLWYNPDGSSRKNFIKIQVNFVENLEYPLVKKNADNFFFGKYEDFQSVFILYENSEWISKIPVLLCYDLREILLEKVFTGKIY